MCASQDNHAGKAAPAPVVAQTRMVPNFFGSWFERMGYDRPGGEEECAGMLDITVGVSARVRKNRPRESYR